mgnify:CR=1 FL=1
MKYSIKAKQWIKPRLKKICLGMVYVGALAALIFNQTGLYEKSKHFPSPSNFIYVYSMIIEE